MSFDIPVEQNRKSFSDEIFNYNYLDDRIYLKIKEILFQISKLDIYEYYIGGGFATACIYGTYINYDKFIQNFEKLYGDIDIYVSSETFEKLKKNTIFKQSSASILNTILPILNQKIQIISTKDRTIKSIISDYDLSINMCYLQIHVYEKPRIHYSRNCLNFNIVKMIHFGNSAKQTTFSRAKKYIERYPEIENFEFSSKSVESFFNDFEKQKCLMENQAKQIEIPIQFYETKIFQSSLKRFNKLEFD